jgi:hypothetical protein
MIKRREDIKKGTVICSKNNIGTKFEKWWQADSILNERYYSFDRQFSCLVSDAIPAYENFKFGQDLPPFIQVSKTISMVGDQLVHTKF